MSAAPLPNCSCAICRRLRSNARLNREIAKRWVPVVITRDPYYGELVEVK